MRRRIDKVTSFGINLNRLLLGGAVSIDRDYLQRFAIHDNLSVIMLRPNLKAGVAYLNARCQADLRLLAALLLPHDGHLARVLVAVDD